jgi:penicillin-binding protein activator
MKRLAAVLVVITLAGCATSGLDNSAGTPTVYSDPGTLNQKGPIGVGIESQDLVSMTDRMMRDMLANLPDATVQTPRRVIVDAEYFRNEGSSRINKNSITDRLRIELNRSSGGRLVFVGRHYADMVEEERALKREGTVDQGTTGLKTATAGADYRLGGRITTMDAVDPKSGMATRYHQISFELVELEKGIIVWSSLYEFRKTAQDDIVYQ